MGKSKRTRIFESLTAVITVIFLGTPQAALAQTSVNLIFNNLTVQTASDSRSYTVNIAFSLHDSAGNPIKDATREDFKVLEDNLEAPITSVEPADDEPISVALLIDTSNSMVGEKMEAARNAASKFIDNLHERDEVAVLTFDNAAVHRIDFTSDLGAARQEMELIVPTAGGGTCLYDAAFESLELTSALPQGRKAVIVLTDGKDEAGGQPCSSHTLDDILDLAAAGKSPIPLYTIGLGNAVDAQALQKMADETGGRYLNSPSSAQLEALFGRLSDELRSQYVLEYKSVLTPGDHSIAVRVNYLSENDEINLKVDFPTRPYILLFVTPQEGAEVSGKNTISVQINGSGEPIKQVVFLANNSNIGAAAIEPFQIEWDPTGLSDGQVFLEAIAQDANGAQLARSGVSLTYHASESEISIVLTANPEPEIGAVKIGDLSIKNSTLLLTGGILIIVLAAAAGLIVFKKRPKKVVDDEVVETKPLRRKENMDATVDAVEHTVESFMPGSGVYGALMVEESDDPSMSGQRFEMTKPVTTLGRKSVNDIMFPKDSPVSRQHAIIEARAGALYLSEVLAEDEQGGMKRPSFGTFVNGLQVNAPVQLKNGDEIRLGKRLLLRIICSEPPCEEEGQTRDKPLKDQITIEAYRKR